MAEAHASPAVGAPARRRSAVYLGSSFVELDEDPSSITLEDLCEAFGTPWESGMHVKHRATGRIVATLPFEPLPSLDEVADVQVKRESAAAGALSADAVFPLSADIGDEAAEQDGDAEADAVTYAVVYDLVTAAAPDADAETEVAAAVVAAGLSDALAPSAEGASSIGEAMRQLVELGAAELLTAEPVSVSQARREYNPPEAPGLLRRMVYSASQYSPYRVERDPITEGKHSLFRSSAAGLGGGGGSGAGGPSPTGTGGAHALTAQDVGEGGPYTSYLDSYALTAPLQVACCALGPLTGGKSALVTPLTAEEQQRIFVS